MEKEYTRAELEAQARELQKRVEDFARSKAFTHERLESAIHHLGQAVYQLTGMPGK